MKRITTSAFAALLSATALSCTGAAYIETEPPPLQVEVRPAQPAQFAIWIDGFWSWRQSNYVWVPGHWESHPRGTWVSGYWEKHRRGYHWVRGYWRNDSHGRHRGR